VAADVQPGTGLGLGATRERLQTLYGSAQTLDIHGASSAGFEVCIKIPFRIEPQFPMDEVGSSAAATF